MPSTSSKPDYRWARIAIALTVFIDMMSFGMAIPDLQLRAEGLGAVGWKMGILLSSYSIAQFFFSPLLGRWSDVAGRRKVLMITCAMTLICFVVYAFANTLELMFISRIVGGISAANIGVAFAYMADITEPEERAAGMGMLGAAFGLGFIFGPVLGAALVKAGGGSPFLLGMVAAGFALINLAFVWFRLPEAPVLQAKAATGIREGLTQLGIALRTPGLGLLISLFFVANFAFSNLESTFFRLMNVQWKLDEAGGAWVLFAVGVTVAVTQGVLVRKWTPRFGEINLLRAGYLLLIPGLLLVPYTPPWIPLLLGAILIGFANGIAGPSVNSLISRSAPPDMQGGVGGIIQSAGAMARIFGPLCGSLLFDLGPAWPYWAGAALMVWPTLAALRYRPVFHESQTSEGYASTHP